MKTVSQKKNSTKMIQLVLLITKVLNNQKRCTLNSSIISSSSKIVLKLQKKTTLNTYVVDLTSICIIKSNKYKIWVQNRWTMKWNTDKRMMMLLKIVKWTVDRRLMTRKISVCKMMMMVAMMMKDERRINKQKT